MRVETLGLRRELEPGARHRFVVLAGDTGAKGDAADPGGEPVERFLALVAPRQAPRDPEVTFVGELGTGDTARFEIIQQGTVVDSTN